MKTTIQKRLDRAEQAVKNLTALNAPKTAIELHKREAALLKQAIENGHDYLWVTKNLKAGRD